MAHHGIVERRPRANWAGHEYWLTPAGDAFRSVLSELGRSGFVHARDLLKSTDLDPTMLLWGFRKRVERAVLPDPRVVVRFEFSGVPARCTKFRILWLILDQSGVDVCAKDPGLPTDLIPRGDIADFVAVYLGHAMWRDMEGKALSIEGDRKLAKQLPVWIRLIRWLGGFFPSCVPPLGSYSF